MTTQSAGQVLDRHYFEVRGRLLEIAACLDRIERADCDGSLGKDARLELIHRAIQVLDGGGIDRAEQIQMIFSDEYEPNWRKSPAAPK